MMRIVSQDKMTDINYNDYSICNVGNGIIAKPPVQPNASIFLGEYRTKVKTSMVMAEIRETWKKEIRIYYSSIVYEMPEV